MKQTALIFFLVLTTSLAHAEIKIVQVKGNKAVVEFHGENLSEGGTLQVADKKDQFADFDGGTAKRNISIFPEFSFSSAKATNQSASVTSVDLSGSVGANFGKYEIGGVLSFTNVSSASGTSLSLLGIGPNFEYNFVENKPGNYTIPGLGLTALYLNSSVGGGKSESGFGLRPDLFLKTFINNNFGLKFTLGYSYSKVDTVSTSGIAMSGGLMVYL